MKAQLTLDIQPQPDDTTCGPTCLHALYRYYGDSIGLDQVIREVPSLREGGTLGVMLASHALARGYRAQIYTYNLMIFDPTWFRPGVDMAAKLRLRAEAVSDPKQRLAIAHYIRFLEQGGRIVFEDLSRSLVRGFLNRQQPLITGLNSTFLYRVPRVVGDTLDDDVRGDVVGHFVVLCGYDRLRKTVLVADPYPGNPYSSEHLYEVRIDRVLGAILLGVMTYDANFLIIEPVSPRKVTMP